MPVMEGQLKVIDTKNLPDRLELRRFVDELYTAGHFGPSRYREMLNRIDTFGVAMFDLGRQVTGLPAAISAS